MQIVLPIKRGEISAMAEYCDPDLMLITEKQLDSSIYSSELLPKGYMSDFRRDRNLNGGHDCDKILLYNCCILALLSRS